MTDITINSTVRQPKRLHPLGLRIMHWVNALAMILMILSGWAIYNDSVIFGWLHIPHWMTIGAGPEGALQWHYFAMWMLMINGLCYLAYGVRYRALPPQAPADLSERGPCTTVRDALRFKLGHDDITHYNAVQKLLYVGVIAVIVVQVISGFAVWKPMQLSELAIALFGDFQGARLVHFIGMALIVGFLVVHVVLALTVPKTIGAMITGGPVVDDDSNDKH